MRIAVFVTSFPVPSETFILGQITGLIDLGHEVKIYAATRPPGGAPVHADVVKYGLLARTTYLDDTIPPASGYWEMPVWPLTGQTWLPGAETPISNAGRALRAIPKLLRCVSRAPRLTSRVLDVEEYGHEALSLSALYRLAALCSNGGRYDVVHAHYGPVGRTFRFSKDLWRTPLVVTFHGYDFSRFPKSDGNRAYVKLFEAVDIVTVNCDYARACLERLGCEPGKVRKLPVGIWLKDFPLRARQCGPGETVRFVTVARLVEKKGIEFTLRALAKVREKHKTVRYDIVGDGPLRESLGALSKDLGIDDAVIWHGARDADYVRQITAGAHIFVLSSITAADGDQEGTPVSLMEAQASGLPVLSTIHSGIPEVVVDRESGFLMGERDVDGLAHHMKYLIENPGVWAEMGRRGRDHVERHFDLQKLNADLSALYETAIKDSKSKRVERR